MHNGEIESPKLSYSLTLGESPHQGAQSTSIEVRRREITETVLQADSVKPSILIRIRLDVFHSVLGTRIHAMAMLCITFLLDLLLFPS